MLGQYNYQLYNPNAPMQSQWQMPNMYQPPIKIPRVNGKDGANAYDMPRSSEALLLDLNDPIIWLVQTDDAGVKTVDELPIVLPVSEEKKAMDTLEERVRKLEEAIHESRVVDVAYTEQPRAKEA